MEQDQTDSEQSSSESDIKTDSSSATMVGINSVLGDVVVDLDERFSQNKWSPGGLPTGFNDLDRALDGLHPGELVVVAGRPEMGVQSFICDLARNVIVSMKKVIFSSMAMPAANTVQRMLASTGSIDLSRLASAQLLDDDWTRLTYALGTLHNAPILFLNNGVVEWSVASIVDAIEEEADKPSLVIVDGIQLFDVSNISSAYDRNIQLSEQIRQLKKMSLRMNIPVLVTASVNRGPESRPNKRPVLSDLRDLGMIEDIADVVLFLYRDEVYNPDSCDRGIVEVMVAKQQRGATGTVRIAFFEEMCRFESLSTT
jgi:replicative DNA helicase